jgi:hypothetical protein
VRGVRAPCGEPPRSSRAVRRPAENQAASNCRRPADYQDFPAGNVNIQNAARARQRNKYDIRKYGASPSDAESRRNSPAANGEEQRRGAVWAFNFNYTESRSPRGRVVFICSPNDGTAAAMSCPIAATPGGCATGLWSYFHRIIQSSTVISECIIM